jgi:UDP-N-acetyl-D-glucosamine dehydrogenase
VAYKPNVNDARESPAIAVLERVARGGAQVSYHDPYVPEARIAKRRLRSVPLSPEILASQDCVIFLSVPEDADHAAIVDGSALVFDARGIFSSRSAEHISHL